MKLHLRGDKLLIGQAVRGKVELRLGLLLGRFGESVGAVTLRLSKAPTGGRPADKRCQISVVMKPTQVRVECTAADLSLALDRAADKAVRSIARMLKRELEANPARGAEIARALETARMLASARVLATANALKPPRTPRAARVLETARLFAAQRVLGTARAAKISGTSQTPRALETARRLASKEVLATARELARVPKVPRRPALPPKGRGGAPK